MSDADLFSPYPVSPSIAREIASHARRYLLEAQEELEALRTNGQAQNSADRRAVRSLATSIDSTDNFVAAILEYNETSDNPRSIVKLNAAFREQREANFGIDPTDYAVGGPCEDRSYDEDVKVAEARLTNELYKEKMLLHEQMVAATERGGLTKTRQPSATPRVRNTQP